MIPRRAASKLTSLSLLMVTHVIVITNSINQAKGHLVIGQRQPGDEEIGIGEARLRGSPDQVISFAETYPGDNVHIITQLRVEEISPDDGGGVSGAHVAVIAGGPGNSFVSLAYSIPRRARTTFKVTLYGKLPPFRKIP